MMNLSEKGEALIKEFESCRLQAYQDSVGIWTIGWGHINGVKKGDTLTQEEADAIFDMEIVMYVDGVNSMLKVDVTQGQFDAMVSFAYNVGLDMDTDDVAEGLGDSTLLKKVNKGDFAGAAEEFPKWNKAGGKVINGLTRRRLAEQALFLS